MEDATPDVRIGSLKCGQSNKRRSVNSNYWRVNRPGGQIDGREIGITRIEIAMQKI
jgi:hypothetical protein